MAKKSRTASQRARSSRIKGHNYERDIRDKFRKRFPEHANRFQRGHQSGGAQGTEQDVKGAWGLWIECKIRSKGVALMSGLEQAMKYADGTDLKPVCFAREDYGDTYVAMTEEDFFEMYEAWLEKKGIINEK